MLVNKIIFIILINQFHLEIRRTADQAHPAFAAEFFYVYMYLSVIRDSGVF